MVRLTATEVARDFSRVLNSVGAGEQVEVLRNGAPVAQMRPARSDELVSAARWRELMEKAPAVDEDFERDVEDARRTIGPPAPKWPS
jgi:antitoxin (DNA-binding transcriptional repressor) of toxin-antitoxin stability system